MASLRKEVRDKAKSLLAEKFCRSCNKHKTQENGKNVLMANGQRRFKCAECREKGRLAKLARMK